MLRKDVKDIKEMVSEMTLKTINKAHKYDELKEDLKKVRFKVSRCVPQFDPNSAQFFITIRYEIDPVVLKFDPETGDILGNERFKAINMLDLISFEDMNLIRDEIDVAKRKNKEVNG